jgi:hypothetical protein
MPARTGVAAAFSVDFLPIQQAVPIEQAEHDPAARHTEHLAQCQTFV